MERIYHKKLVRDRIPEVIENNNGEYETRILNDNEFEIELRKKLVEEAIEVSKADDSELLGELADVMEIIKTLAAKHNLSLEIIEEKRLDKKEKRGGFDKKLFLEWSSEE